MRLAWFRASPPGTSSLLDPGAALARTISRLHDVDLVTETEAHDFVWKHDRKPYDLCIYEIGRTSAGEFPWPYLLHYPGVLVLGSTTLADRRGWGRSRAIVVADAAVAQSLEAEWPGARLRVYPLGADPGSWQSAVGSLQLPPVAGSFEARDPAHCPLPTAHDRGSTPLQVGVLGEGWREVVGRAVERAAHLGRRVTLLPDTPPEDVLPQADVVVAAEWPLPAGPPFGALHAMAASLPVIVPEAEATAGWPAFDPQTWRPRGFSTETPIVISIDLRDGEHSLVLAFVRLAADAGLREALGAAGHAWWDAHGRVDRATVAFEQILREAATLGPAAAVPVLDGGERARQVLGEIGVTVDFL